MATVTKGGVIPNKGVNLTCIGEGVLPVGTWVEITDPYYVELNDTRGDFSALGYIIVGNKVSGEDVTVATRFKLVDTFVMGMATNAGDPVVVGDDGKLWPYSPSASPGYADDCCMIVGIALTDSDDCTECDVGIF